MSDRERLLEMATAECTEGLATGESEELRSLLSRQSDLKADEFALAAAALELAMVPHREALPQEIRSRILRTARQSVTGALTENAETAQSGAPSKSNWLPWAIAAGALLFAVLSWWPPQRGPRLPDAATERSQLVRSADDLMDLTWTATQDPSAESASGDVVWSPSRQAGFMRFQGLEVNDPSQSQYQLWIFDSTRDQRYPVDGGVFDIDHAGQTIVPIRARLPVGDAVMFAVTVEKPGGVVVSSRERIVVIAQRDG